MVKNVTIAIALGILSALLLSFAFPGAGAATIVAVSVRWIIMASLAIVPLFAAGLGFGLATAVISVLTGAVMVSIFATPMSGLIYALFCGLPVLAIVRQALQWREDGGKVYWYPVERLTLLWAGLGVIPTLAAATLLWTNEDLRAELTVQYDSFLAQMETMGAAPLTMTADEYLGFALQFIGPMWALFLLLGGSLAQGLLVRFEKNIRPTPELNKLKLPLWAHVLFLGLAALIVLFQGLGAIAGALVIMLSIAFLIQGMVIIHQISKGWSVRGPLLVTIYILLILMLWPALLVIIVGLVDHWVGFRARFAPEPSQEED